MKSRQLGRGWWSGAVLAVGVACCTELPAAEPPPGAPAAGTGPSLAQAVAKVDGALAKAREALAALDRIITDQADRIERLKRQSAAATDTGERRTYQEALVSAVRQRDGLGRQRADLTALVERLAAQRTQLEPPP